MGLFITFEGGEGSGKTLQAKALHRKLMQAGTPVILTHEPGGTEAGEKIARLLKQLKEIEMVPLTELLLFNASRAQHINQVIKPNLEFGKVVICDRYTDSTVTYQGYGRGLDLETVKTVNDFATGGLKPDLTILMDIPPEEGFNRINNIRGREKDRFEQEDIEFHRKIREGFLRLVADEPERWLVVDATLSKERIKKIIWNKVSTLINK
jgi:dTMP kinase